MPDNTKQNKMPSAFNKNDLKALSKISIDSNKARLIDRELQAIKRMVLEQNNLGHMSCNYIYNYNPNSLVIHSDDYFNDILSQLIDIFPDSIISYITSNSNPIIYSNKTSNTYTNNNNIPVTNTITIDWS